METNIPLFIPSYHRPDNLKTVRYFVGKGYPSELIHVFIDSEADDREAYREACTRYKCHLHVFDMGEARERFDYVHRPSVSRRSAGQARNMFYDYARKHGIDFYVVQDDDTSMFQVRPFLKYDRPANISDIIYTFEAVRDMMVRKHIGLFGLSQTGDAFAAGEACKQLFRRKVMNTTFVCTRYIYRGERGVQDDDTSMYAGIYNEGLFTGSTFSGLVLLQTPSAEASGGLTDLYKECKLLNKSLVCPIQYPSAIRAEKQTKNGGRLHHRINYRYLMPCVMKGERDNIAWDAYPEDGAFTREPKRSDTEKYKVVHQSIIDIL